MRVYQHLSGADQCNGGFACTDGVCIDDSWKCDKDKDCADGEDESTDICSMHLHI